MDTEKPGLGKIKVKITPKGEGKIEVQSETGPINSLAFPDNLTGTEALERAKKLKEMTVDYELEIEDHSRDN